MRPGDEKTVIILAMQAEMDALGLLPDSGSAPKTLPPPRIRATGRAPEQPCGTDAGARRHRRRNEPLCKPCQVAERSATAERHERSRVRKEAAA